MSKREIIICLMGLLLGFIVSKVFKIIRLDRYRADTARTLIDCLKYENELTKQNGASDMIEYTAKTKGKDYAVYYYGQIYRALSGALDKKSDAQAIEVTNALGTFLSVALQKDISEYKQTKNKRKNKKS